MSRGGDAPPFRASRWVMAVAISAWISSAAVTGCKDFGDPVQPAGSGNGDSIRTVTFSPVKDNTLYEDPQGSLSNGAGGGMFAGTTEAIVGHKRRRALIAFDFADSIPAGATIRSVRLVLHMSRTVSAAKTVSLRRVLADWGEGSSTTGGGTSTGQGGGGGAPAATNDATWVHRFYATLFWSTPGGDFATTPSAQIQVAGIGSYTWGSTAEMVADVESWLQDPVANYGWILVGEEQGIGSAKRFDTRQSVVAADRPQLEVEYSPPTQVATGKTDRTVSPHR